MRRLALVVDTDPRGCTSLSRGHAVFLDRTRPLVIGRGLACDLVIEDATVARAHCRVEHRGDRFVVVDTGESDAVWVNGRRVRGQHLAERGDVVAFADVQLRFDVVDPDPLARVLLVNAALGAWLAIDSERVDVPGRCRAFSRERGLGWLVTFDVEDPAVADLGRAAGTHPSLPPIVDEISAAGLVHRAHVAGGGVPLPRFLARAAPASDAVARRVARDVDGALAAVVAVAWRTPPLRDFVVTWDGGTLLLPARGTPGDAQRADLGRTVAASLGLRARTGDAGELAGDDELAAVVRALFPDEWRAELALREQLATLDETGVRWLVSRSRA